MDDISRGSLADSPGQGVEGIADRTHDIAPGRIKGPTECTDAAAEEREELLMGPHEPADESDDVPVEDRPGAELPAAADVDGIAAADGPPPAGQLPPVLCALLLSSRESVSLLRLAQATHLDTKTVRAGLEDLKTSLLDSGLPLEVSLAGDQVRMLTTPVVFGYLRNLRTVKKPEKLSAAALETLAVVAYRQPVIRAEVEAIRGVKAGPILRTLLDHRMIRTVGRADVPGHPLQYGTTQHFLETFGLEGLADLPSVKEFRSL